MKSLLLLGLTVGVLGCATKESSRSSKTEGSPQFFATSAPTGGEITEYSSVSPAQLRVKHDGSAAPVEAVFVFGVERSELQLGVYLVGTSLGELRSVVLTATGDSQVGWGTGDVDRSTGGQVDLAFDRGVVTGTYSALRPDETIYGTFHGTVTVECLSPSGEDPGVDGADPTYALDTTSAFCSGVIDTVMAPGSG